MNVYPRPYLLFGENGKIAASCTTLSATQAAMRLLYLQHPVQPPSKPVVLEHPHQQEDDLYCKIRC